MKPKPKNCDRCGKPYKRNVRFDACHFLVIDEYEVHKWVNLCGDCTEEVTNFILKKDTSGGEKHESKGLLQEVRYSSAR